MKVRIKRCCGHKETVDFDEPGRDWEARLEAEASKKCVTCAKAEEG